MGAVTPETQWDRLTSAVTGVSGIELDGVYLDNDQAPWTKLHRSARLLPQGWVDAELERQVAGRKIITQTIVVRLRHRIRPKQQDTDRQSANADSLAVWRAIETNSTLRAGTWGGARVTEQAGPTLSESGDFALSDLTVQITHEVGLS